MAKRKSTELSRRERQIMDAVYETGQATVSEAIERMADPPSYSAVRALLNILVEKGVLRVDRDSRQFIYRPTKPRRQVGRSRIKQVVQTFFDGSLEKAMAAMIETHDVELTSEEIEKLQALVEQARQKGNQP
jgi:BlaI family transcriptional regulator, penicillinase repressor